MECTATHADVALAAAVGVKERMAKCKNASAGVMRRALLTGI